MVLSKCKSCGAEVVWVKTRSKLDKNGEEIGNKNMPIDATSANGSTVFNAQEGHISHFATCINAATHRKPKAK